jgi:hypothetical protein
MRTLKEILTTLADTEAEASIDASAADPRVMAGVEAKVRNAKQALDGIRREYREALMQSTVTIAVTGSTAKDFAKSAEKAGAITVDFDSIIDRFTDSLLKRGTGPEYTSDAHFKLLDELAKIRIEFDIVQLRNPEINAYSDGIYGSPIREAVTKLLYKNYGTELQSVVARKEIADKALESRFSGKKLPVILYNVDPTQSINNKYIPTPVTTLTSNVKVLDNNVKKRLAEVKSMLKEQADEALADEAQTQVTPDAPAQEEV